MAVNKTSTIFHLIAFAHHMITWYTVATLDFTKLPAEELLILKKLKNMGGRFLTNWNFFQQTLYIIVAIAIDIFPLVSENSQLLKKLNKFNGYNFTSLVLPFSIYIPIFFWTIFNIDRNLIFPEVLDLTFPKWANHSLHSVIALFVIIEIFVTRRRPPVFSKAFRGLTIYAGIYCLVLVGTYFQKGIWLYEYLGVINWPMRILYFALTYGSLIIFLKLGHLLQTYLYEKAMSAGCEVNGTCSISRKTS